MRAKSQKTARTSKEPMGGTGRLYLSCIKAEAGHRDAPYLAARPIGCSTAATRLLIVRLQESCHYNSQMAGIMQSNNERISCTQFWTGPRVPLSEKRQEVQGTQETPQEIGDVGHPAVLLENGPSPPR